jgi:hypothetical protein
MRNVTGALAQGNDFYGRGPEMARFWRNLETDNILLLAPRRVGKTSLMRKMGEDSARHGFTTIFVDVADCSDELHFVQRLYAAILGSDEGESLWSQVKDSWLGKTVERVQKIGGAGFSLEFREDAASWSRLGEEFAGAVSKLDGRWLIQVDELPVFVLKMLGKGGEAERARVREFLYWMRRIRQQHSGVRWILAGSIGLDTVTARLNMADAINDLRIEKLGAFDAVTADGMLRSLAAAYQVQLEEEVRGYIVSRAGWPAPYYLQLVFHELRELSGAVTEANVDAAIEYLLGPQHKNYFDYWRQRLYEELGTLDAELALGLLNHCCRTPEGVKRSSLSLVLAGPIAEPLKREEKLRYLMDIFENDGYLAQVDGRWCFRSPLLREFWLRRVAPPLEMPEGPNA